MIFKITGEISRMSWRQSKERLPRTYPLQKVWSQVCAMVPGSSTLGMVTKMTKSATQKARVVHATPSEQHALDCRTLSSARSGRRPAAAGTHSARSRQVPAEASAVSAAAAHSAMGTVMSMMMMMTRQKWYRLRFPMLPPLQSAGTTPIAVSSPTILRPRRNSGRLAAAGDEYSEVKPERGPGAHHTLPAMSQARKKSTDSSRMVRRRSRRA